MFTYVIKINIRNLINYICMISVTKKCLSFHILMKCSIKELDFYYRVFNPLRLCIKTWHSPKFEWVHSNTLTATRQKAGKQLKYWMKLPLPQPRFEWLSYWIQLHTFLCCSFAYAWTVIENRSIRMIISRNICIVILVVPFWL
jgi:hypothetical protein